MWLLTEFTSCFFSFFMFVSFLYISDYTHTYNVSLICDIQSCYFHNNLEAGRKPGNYHTWSSVTFSQVLSVSYKCTEKKLANGKNGCALLDSVSWKCPTWENLKFKWNIVFSSRRTSQHCISFGKLLMVLEVSDLNKKKLHWTLRKEISLQCCKC